MFILFIVSMLSLCVCAYTNSHHTMEDRGQCAGLGSLRARCGPCTVQAVTPGNEYLYILRHRIVVFLSFSNTVVVSCPVFQTIIDAKHVYMCLFATCISCLMNCVYKFFIHLKKITLFIIKNFKGIHKLSVNPTH